MFGLRVDEFGFCEWKVLYKLNADIFNVFILY